MYRCICLLTQELPDTDNTLPFKNTTPINQNSSAKKERRADWSD